MKQKKARKKAEKLTFKNRIGEYIYARNITCYELSKRLNKSNSYVYTMISKRRFPHPRLRIALLQALNCKFDDIFYEVLQ